MQTRDLHAQLNAPRLRDDSIVAGHTAAPMVSGVILQLERGLYHLSKAGADEAVAVELVDDISVHRDGKTVTQEQDKKSISQNARLLGDRSKDLWRTLQIWVDGFRENGSWCRTYLIVTNTRPTGAVVAALRSSAAQGNRSVQIVQALRQAGAGKARRSGKLSQIQRVIDDVLSLGDDALADLANRIELVEEFDVTAAKIEIANGFGIDPGVDRDLVLYSLSGWFAETLKQAWERGKPGVVTREACLNQCSVIERSVLRRRLVPRPASEIRVDGGAIENARGRPFVDHLGRIETNLDEILQAIEHFIQFNTEKHRLVAEGEIPFEEWANRGERLKQRWAGVVRRVALNHRNESRITQGRHILADTTYDHYENLAGQACEELYMTAGHYHRLADDDAVWWDPEYTANDDA